MVDLVFSGHLAGAIVPATEPAVPPVVSDTITEDGLTFTGWLQVPIVPPDPTGLGWRGPAGPVGPAGPAGPVGDQETFVFSQVSPASTWVIAHMLGRFPGVDIVDSAGTLVEGDVVYNSSFQITVTFSASFAGIAYLN